MRITKLMNNIIDQIKEGQIKLGYVKETVRLYYPIASLKMLLDMKDKDITSEDFAQELEVALEEEWNIAGKVQVRKLGERIEVSVSPDSVEYIHKNVKMPMFLADIIELFQHNHHCTLEEIRQIFERYSSNYVCEKMPDDSDFDYVLYFIDGEIDDYYYCIKMEMGHTIYHRFTKGDYEALVE